ncbi:MAG: hypothetical protein WBB27_16660 [Maribacter sp.]
MSYAVPLIFISIILLAQSTLKTSLENIGLQLWIPAKDLLILAVGYGITIKYPNKMPIHEKGMILADLVLI